jgi:hypothetical protein
MVLFRARETIAVNGAIIEARVPAAPAIAVLEPNVKAKSTFWMRSVARDTIDAC